MSLVIHPHNPYVPTSHVNVRFFIAEKEGRADLVVWWRLRPDALLSVRRGREHWHQVSHELCQPFGTDIYPEFKSWVRSLLLPQASGRDARGGWSFFDET